MVAARSGGVLVDLRLWGKERGLAGARYPLVCHGLDTAAAVRALWEEFLASGLRARMAQACGLSEPQMCAVLEFWAALHDIGKVTPSFQRQVEMPAEFPGDAFAVRVRHDEASHLWLPTGLGMLGYPDAGRRSMARVAAALLGGHHGTFHAFEGASLLPGLHGVQGLGESPVWERQRTAVLTLLAEVLSPSVPTNRLPLSAAALISGVVVLADWLVSQTGYVRSRLPQVPQRGDVESLRTFFDSSLEPVRGLVRQAGLSRLRLRAGSFPEEFPGLSPNELQDSIATKLPPLVTGAGLLMVAAPMGFGKTETALHAARVMGQAAGMSGLFVALPTMATADQMFARVARYLARRSEEGVSQSLLHGMAWLNPVEEMLAEAGAAEGITSDERSRVWAAEWLRGAKRGLLAGVGVGTVDQALLSVLPVRHNALRLSALAGKTVVIDEVHAFDDYMRQLLATLLNWLGECGVPVVLLSATLPRHVAAELSAAYVGGPVDQHSVVPYPGWTYLQRDTKPASHRVEFPAERRRTVQVDVRAVATGAGGEPNRIPVLRDVLDPVAQVGGCTTVSQAQRTYADLREWARQHGVRLRLLHSRFPVHQREEITQRITYEFGKPASSEDPSSEQRPQRAVLVASPAIEQSLDVDFDLLVTDLAPIELVLQRTGRLQRHPAWERDRPAWAVPDRGGQRRVVVLSTPDNALREQLPPTWSLIYPTASLVRAHRLLHRYQQRGLVIPDDVQTLVDRGNPGPFAAPDDDLLDGFVDAEMQRSAQSMVESQTGHRLSIARPRQLRDLAELSQQQIDEEQASTRFNADSVRVLPYFLGPDQVPRLGTPDGPPLPVPDEAGLTREQAIAVMRHSIPVPGSLVRDHGDRHTLPEPWRDLWPLSELAALTHRVDSVGQTRPARVGGRHLLLDADLGLCEVPDADRLR